MTLSRDIVLLATPCHLSASTLTGRLDRHSFRRHQTSNIVLMRFFHVAWNDSQPARIATRKVFVCLSVKRKEVKNSSLVKRVDCDKTEERSVQIFMPYEISFSLVFWEEEWLVGATPSTWNFGSTSPRLSEIADFEPIFARSSSALTHGEKSSINNKRKSTTYFPSSYVAAKPKKGAKTQNGRFPCIIAFHLKKVCYKVSSCENCQRRSCKAFIR